MSLSNSITTLLIDPRSSNNTRTEFRLDDDFYSSTLKLIDVGVFSTEVAGENGGAKICTYPQVNGVYQCIRNIYLYSGSTLIDSVQNCAEYSSIQALKTNNQGSTDLNREVLSPWNRMRKVARLILVSFYSFSNLYLFFHGFRIFVS